MPNEIIGLLGKNYVAANLISANANTDWIEIDIASEGTGSDERNEAVVKDRRSEFEKYIYGQRATSDELTLTYVKGSNVLDMLRDSYTNNTPIAFASCTGTITTNTEEGYMYDASVASMGQPQPFEDVWTVNVTLKPAPVAAEGNNSPDPAFFVVGA